MPEIRVLHLDECHGRFVLEPLERGYGQTIGNALRRVLFSSIQGAAVSAVRIERVFHEFAPIPGVKEDTTQLLLNLKDLSIRVDDELLPLEEDQVLRLKVKGPGRVTGADIECPEGLTIVNKDCYLATLSDPDETLELELYVGWGVGYVLPEKHDRFRGVIGVIATGSQYTPVRKVNYIVEQTRVGMRTDYERMVLDVTTNGSVLPNDAVSQAAHILDKYFRMFFDLGQAGLEAGLLLSGEHAPELANIPDVRIEELEFAQRTFNCLRRAGLNTLRALATATESDLSSIRGFGKKSLQEVREKLAEYGLEMLPPKGGVRIAESLTDDDEDQE